MKNRAQGTEHQVPNFLKEGQHGGEFDLDDFCARSNHITFCDYHPAFSFSFLPLPLAFHLHEKPGRKKERNPTQVATGLVERSDWGSSEEATELRCGPPLTVRMTLTVRVTLTVQVTHNLPHFLGLLLKAAPEKILPSYHHWTLREFILLW